LTAIQIDADFVADLVFALWFLGRHASVTGSGGTLSAVGSHHKVPPRVMTLRGVRLNLELEFDQRLYRNFRILLRGRNACLA
jgi:hypothetical protein